MMKIKLLFYAATLSFLVMLFMSSCTPKTVKRQLAVLDSISNVNPVEAVRITDSILANADGIPENVRMRFVLLNIKARNSSDKPFEIGDVKQLVEYFDSHGNANERMLANYILGYSYFRQNDAPKALHYYQTAVAQADTLSKDCDYKTLCKIYMQISNVFQKQMSLDVALDMMKEAQNYAILTKDTFLIIASYVHLSDSYYLKGQLDSVLCINEKSSDLYAKHGYVKQAASAYGSTIFIMTDRGETDKVKPYMDIYEKSSGIFDKKTNTVKRGREIYYYCKGLYYLNKNMRDSAEFFFRKEFAEASDYNNRQAASKGLYLLFKKSCDVDSIVKYCEMWNAFIDSSYVGMSTLHLQQMKVMYDYTNNKQIAEQKTEESHRYKIRSTVLSAVLLLAFLIVPYWRRKLKDRLKELDRENALYLARLTQKDAELQSLKEEKNNDYLLIEKKEEEVAELKKNLTELQHLKRRQRTVDDFVSIYYDSQIADHLHHLAIRGKKATIEDKMKLIALFRKEEPEYIDFLEKYKSSLNENEYIICLLLKLSFIPSEMVCLLDITSQRLSNIRQRLNKKIFGKEGGAKEFDYKIKSL